MLDIKQIKNRLATHQPQTLPLLDSDQQAAVAMLVRHTAEGLQFLLIRRAEHKNDPWSGDLGFPGGRIEPEDATPRAAAERETWEEIGLHLKEECYLGQGDDLTGAYLSVHISCFIYAIDSDQQFTLNGEVVDLFWIPLQTLLEPHRNRLRSFFYRGQERSHPVVDLKEWSERPLWGITYRLLDNFLNLFDLSFTHQEQL